MFGFLSQMSTLEQKECIVRPVGPIVQLHFFHFCPSFQQFSIGTLVFFCSRVGQFALELCHSTHDTLVLSSLQYGWIEIYSFERFLLPQTEKPLIYSKANHEVKLHFSNVFCKLQTGIPVCMHRKAKQYWLQAMQLMVMGLVSLVKIKVIVYKKIPNT